MRTATLPGNIWSWRGWEKGTEGCPSGKAFHSSELNGFDFVLTECFTGPWKEAVGTGGGEWKVSNDLFSDIFPDIIQTCHNYCTHRYYILLHQLGKIWFLFIWIGQGHTHTPNTHIQVFMQLPHIWWLFGIRNRDEVISMCFIFYMADWCILTYPLFFCPRRRSLFKTLQVAAMFASHAKHTNNRTVDSSIPSHPHLISGHSPLGPLWLGFQDEQEASQLHSAW